MVFCKKNVLKILAKFTEKKQCRVSVEKSLRRRSFPCKLYETLFSVKDIWNDIVKDIANAARLSKCVTFLRRYALKGYNSFASV